MHFKVSILLIFILNNGVRSMIVDMTRDFSEHCIRAHNEKRRLHGAPDLVYGDEISSYAENGAYSSSLKGKMILPQDTTYGQNIAFSSIKRSCDEVVELWYKDHKYYDFNNPSFKPESGSFSQIVWKDTRRIACSQYSKKYDEWYTVCVYDPPGNVKNKQRFRENVSPSYYTPEEEDTVNTIEEPVKRTNSVIDLTTQSFVKKCVQAHNKVRSIHRAEDLIFDKKLLKYARKKVAEYAISDDVDYSDSKYGSNSMSRTKQLDCDYAMDKWYEQKKFYDFSSPQYQDEATSFMQLVWKSTTKIACAAAQSTVTNKYYLTCVYDPAGLVRGKYKENISPASRLTARVSRRPPTVAVTTSRPRTSTVQPHKEIDAEFFGASIFFRYGAG